jgi:hypothetical protein
VSYPFVTTASRTVSEAIETRRSVRDFKSDPVGELVFCGISIGYALPDSAVNQLRSERVQVHEFAKFQGYTEL